MENETLTTGDNDPQVNETEQVDTSNEVSEEQVSNDTNTLADDSAYNDAWDNIDVNDDASLDNVFETNADEQVAEDESDGGIDPLDDVSTNDTNNSIGAFMVDKPVLKFKGKDVPIDSSEELIKLAQKGFLLETEMSNIKPKKKLLKIVDGIPLEVLQAVADLNSGKKEAIDYLKSEYGIKDSKPAEDNSIWGSDNEESVKEEKATYTPSVKAEDPVAEFFSDITSSDPVFGAKVNETYSSLDDGFKSEVYDIKVFPTFVKAVETGEFETIYPLAVKEKALNPAMSWIQAYGMAAQKVNSVEKPKTVEPPVDATSPKVVHSQRTLSESDAADRVWNDPEYYKELEASLFG